MRMLTDTELNEIVGGNRGGGGGGDVDVRLGRSPINIQGDDSQSSQQVDLRNSSNTNGGVFQSR